MEVYWFLLIAVLLATFTVIPLGVDLLRFFFPHWRLSRVVGKAAHIFLVATVTGLFLIIIYYHHFVFLPVLLSHQSPFDSTTGLFHVVFSTWLWLNVLGNYYHTISMHPGADNSFSSWRLKFEEAKLASYGINIEPPPVIQSSAKHPNENGGSCVPVCRNKRLIPRTGTDWRPSRTHICSVCHCAVFYWDHHCPFTGNCIGLRNYSNFFLGLCYGVTGGCYAAVITWPFFFHCNILPLFDTYEPQTVCTELGASSYIFLLILLGLWLTLCTLLLNVILLLADLSTYDVLKYWNKYPMVQFIFQRICAGKCLDDDSRFRILILNRREHFLWYLVPIRNSKLSV